MASKAFASVPVYLAIQACAGIAVGSAFALVLLVTDTGGLGVLVRDQGPLEFVTICLGSLIAICTFVISTAVGLLAWERH
jgi:hypothetical protein